MTETLPALQQCGGEIGSSSRRAPGKGAQTNDASGACGPPPVRHLSGSATGSHSSIMVPAPTCS